jgi:hypothetical protein
MAKHQLFHFSKGDSKTSAVAPNFDLHSFLMLGSGLAGTSFFLLTSFNGFDSSIYSLDFKVAATSSFEYEISQEGTTSAAYTRGPNSCC